MKVQRTKDRQNIQANLKNQHLKKRRQAQALTVQEQQTSRAAINLNQRYGIQAKMIPTIHTTVPTTSTTATATAINSSSNTHTNTSSKKSVHINIGTGLSSKRQLSTSSRHNSSKGIIKDTNTTTRITINRSSNPDDVAAENKNTGSSKKEL